MGHGESWLVCIKMNSIAEAASTQAGPQGTTLVDYNPRSELYNKSGLGHAYFIAFYTLEK